MCTHSEFLSQTPYFDFHQVPYDNFFEKVEINNANDTRKFIDGTLIVLVMDGTLT